MVELTIDDRFSDIVRIEKEIVQYTYLGDKLVSVSAKIDTTVIDIRSRNYK